MTIRAKSLLIIIITLAVSGLCATPLWAKKRPHPFDKYDHEMHMGFFEMVPVACEMCHADPESFGNRKKVNPLGCHFCHNSPDPPLPATNDCTVCHEGGPPKPPSHKTDWVSKHQAYAKQDPAYCQVCHTNAMFCTNCHGRRDTIQQKVHRRNFKFFHSIEARANPRRCDACHTVDFCKRCHEGRGDSGR